MRLHAASKCKPLLLIPFQLALSGGVYGQSMSGSAQTDAMTSVVRGERIYKEACAACHGVNGDGQGPAAAALDPRPRDLRSGVYKFRSTPTGDLPTDEDLYRIITDGIPRTMMPGYGRLLTDKDRYDVVAYIKTFSDDFNRFGPGTPITIPPEPAITPQSIAEGKSLYMIMECWACHGVKGKGDGKSAKDLEDDWGYRSKPFDFTVGNYKGGNDNRSIYKTFITGVNGTPMPSYEDAFLFGRESIGDYSTFREAYPESDIAGLRNYLESQPTESELASMSEEERQRLVTRREWALVHFVKSLSRKKGLFYTLFVEKTDQTQ